MPNYDRPDPPAMPLRKQLNPQRGTPSSPADSWLLISNQAALALGSSLVMSVFAALASWLFIHGLTLAAASRILVGGGSIGLVLGYVAGCSHSFRLRLVRPTIEATEKRHE
ncbi:hypothetical protein [Streptomyces sp. NBC_00696]|uniref:hypothetical protein n=1 Tax=Streptomyces sp. NBC_00696 TaxID=2903672 RepID=UPI002E366AE9|nr:hypothetical protein [Streptomyces sp. NBC_00696]